MDSTQARVVPEDQRVVFGPTMEGLWRSLDPCTPAEQAAFQRAGVKGGAFQAAFPIADYVQVLETVVSGRYAALPRHEAFRSLGRLITQHFGKSLIGRATFTLLQVLGPRRSLLRSDRYFRNANNFTETRVDELAPNRFLLHFRHIHHAGLFHGIIEVTAEQAGARHPKVVLLKEGDHEATFEVSWE